MREISLYDLTQCALVVPFPSGVRYVQQAGGTACLQPALEGVLIPVAHDTPTPSSEQLECRLMALFPEGSPGDITEAIADQIDGLLAASPLTAAIRVNKARLSESREAWLHVVLDQRSDTDTVFADWHGESAVLTWPNSD